jgi:hypothetical protein
VLWIAGANSTLRADEDRPLMDALFPATRLVRIKNAGHWVHSEQPEVFLETRAARHRLLHTHGLSEPAWASALEVLAANDVTVLVDAAGRYTPTPAVSHAILTANRGKTSGLADGIVVTPSHNPPRDGGFKYNPPHGGPADTDATGWIAGRANDLLRQGLERRAPGTARPGPQVHPALRLPRHLRRRPRRRGGPRRDPGGRRADRRRSPGRGQRRLLGGHRRAAPAST